jgi:hypothetical protein
MTLAEFQAKYKDVLLSAPGLAADMADMVQDERADEREQCALFALQWWDDGEGEGLEELIRNRNTKESN